jgi:hypothetical protein
MDEVNDQIDRLNLALQHVMDGIANTTLEPRISITNSHWLENSSEESLEIPDQFEERMEQLHTELDRSQMRVEDFWSEQRRRLNKVSFTRAELYELIAGLNTMFTGKECVVQVGGTAYALTLAPSEPLFDQREVTVIERSIMDCGHDMLKIRKEIALDVERQLQEKKKKFIEEVQTNIEKQLEEIEKLKQNYVDKLKELVSYSKQLEQRERNVEVKEKGAVKGMNFGDLPEDLEERLKTLEAMRNKADREDEPRIALMIEQVKNKISNLRVEKAISESKQTSFVLNRLAKAMENEVYHDEKQRKKTLEKFHQTHNRTPSDFDRATMVTLKKQEENFRVYMEKTRARLKKKESELWEREKVIEEKWAKISGSREFIELMQSGIEKLNFLKDENERERDLLEREKLDLINLNEKIKKAWASIEQFKRVKSLENAETVASDVASIKLDPRSLGFS